jgi:hypothetical protein
MIRPVALMRKAVNVLLSEGPTSLLARSGKSLNTRIRNRVQQAALSEIERVAQSNIPNSTKFARIYRRRLWLKVMPHLNPEKTLSGHGSTQLSTKVLRTNLEYFLRESNVKTFFDAPCGDFNWMKNVNLPGDCQYIGGDIVAGLIERLQQSYGRTAVLGNKKSSSREFIAFDLTSDSFPMADVWLCKDCFQHLSNDDIQLVLDNFRRSQVKLALISNHVGVSSNIEIRTGQFRHVDLTRAPFNLPPPRQTLADAPVDGEPRYIGVWRREDLG